jgi:small subunit ribosomal protein S17e
MLIKVLWCDMGRIKSAWIKKLGKKLVKEHPDRFTTDFETNKLVLKELNVVDSKKIRNKIAGYIVRLLKKKAL